MAKKKAPKIPETFHGRTHICFVLDKSGSMSSQRDSAISGFNEYLAEQQKLTDDTVLSLILFDTTVATPVVDTKLADVPQLTPHAYVPNGCTALFDAVGRAIALTEPKVKKDDRALVVILTDGLENSSRQITSHEQIRDIIKLKEKDGNWTFTYMGCGENWQQEAAAMNIAMSNMTALDPTNVRASMGAMAAATKGYRLSASARSTNFYSGSRPGTPRPAPRPMTPRPAVVKSSAPPRQTRPTYTNAINPFSQPSGEDQALRDLINRAGKK